MAKGYSQMFKDRAVWIVTDRLADDRSCAQWKVISEIASRLGVSVESMRCWYEQSLINTGQCLGFTREEYEEIKRLKCENAELR